MPTNKTPSKKKEFKYTIKANYKIGVAVGAMSWSCATPLDPALLTELIALVKEETGTTKEIFITSIFVSEGELSYLDELTEQTKS